MGTSTAQAPARYDWKRFWCPRDGMLDLSDGGYLRSPTGILSRLRSQVVPYSEMEHHHAIVLLGEPGIGKSTECAQIMSGVQQTDSTTGDTLLFLDLERCRDHSYLEANLVNRPQYKAWLEGSHKLFVFFDNFERLGIRPHLFAEDLETVLKMTPLDRLYVRFISRTFDWSSRVERTLQNLFKNKPAVHELAPLTRADVELAATTVLGDAKNFMSDIGKADIVPLAISPITLRFLINKYKRSGKLPTTATDLYADGCEILCEESNENLRDSGLIGTLAPKQRLAIASRIAAVLMLSQKYAVWTGSDQGDVPDEDIKLTDLVGGKERFHGVEVDVTMDTLKETLKTGLFSSRGAHRCGFAHQTYAEFLSAVFFNERCTKPKQILSLLLHPGDPEKRVVPQLAGVAGWVASFVPEVFDLIVQSDPQALLASDLEKLTGDERKRVVESFLDLLKEDRIHLWEISQRYPKLNHPDLDSQIREVIHDTARDSLVRREALRIAGACNLKSLQDDFVKIALDPNEPNEVRQFAGLALTDIDDPSALHKLLPLALGQAGSDPDDELKGLGLTSVYPNHISTEQLFKLLTPIKNQSLLGAYVYFLTYTLPERIPQSDIPIALDWVLKSDRRQTRTPSLNREEQFSDDLMWFCWQRCDDDNILPPFAEVALARLLKFDHIVGGIHGRDFDTSLNELTDRRRSLAKEMIQIGARKRKTSILDLAYTIRRILTAEDFSWLIDELMVLKAGRKRELIVQLSAMTFSFRTDHLEVLFVTAEREVDLQTHFTWLKKVYELGSAEAENEKERYERLYGKKEQKLLQPPPAERVSILLDKSEKGEPIAWYRLIQELTLEPDSREDTEYGDIVEQDIEELPGWQAADEDTRRRLISAAKAFLQAPSCDPKTSEWLCTNTLSWLAIAGTKALHLLKTHSTSDFEALSNDVWERFFGILLLYPNLGNQRQRANQIELLRHAYSRVPSALSDAIAERIKFDNSDSKHLGMSTAISEILDGALSDKLLSMIAHTALSLEVRGQILKLLLDKQFESARLWAKELLSQRTNGAVDALTITAATGLVNNWTKEEWPKIWTMISQDGAFGDAVLGEIASWWRSNRVLSHLTDDQLADLFIWMFDRYPIPDDRGTQIVKRMGVADMVRDLRLQIPNYLLNRGTLTAVAALSKILDRYPELVGVRSMMADCLAKFRRTSWIPYAPEYILQLTNNAELRLISSEDELLDLVLESLERLQRELKGHGSTAEQLWNAVPISYVNRKTGEKQKKGEHGKKKYLPRDEAALCNFVAAHLNRDLKARGIIINREVEVRLNLGAKGERTDIHIDAVKKNIYPAAFERVTVVIEAKGSWNSGIETDMETQLAEQYLAESACQSGIYLVGWFNCSQWDDDDYRRADSFKHQLQDLKDQLERQALQVSKNGLKITTVLLDASLRELPPSEE